MLRFNQITIDATDYLRLQDFWAAALNCAKGPVGSQYAHVEPRDSSLPKIIIQQVPEPKQSKNRVHLDFGVEGDGEDEIERLLSLGATTLRLVDGDRGSQWWIMADPEANEFCVGLPRFPRSESV